MNDWDGDHIRGPLQARDEFQRVVVSTQSRSGRSLWAGIRPRYKISFREDNNDWNRLTLARTLRTSPIPNRLRFCRSGPRIERR